MTVHCPHCLTGYLIPERLLGAGGARVRCPGCEEVFVVLPEGEAVGEAGGAGEADAGQVLPEAVSDTASGGGAGTPARGAERATEPEPRAPAAAALDNIEHEPARDATPAAEPAMIAGAVLDVLADFLGESLTRSRARGTVLSDHGPAIIAVWDEYRRRAGVDAPSAIFRAVLRDRCGVDLSHTNGN